ncbi:MAG: hypothetical protein Q4C99_04095 [Clostridia bacterium]|nr:hypothetical protein [Clostridia bacterium]
MVSYNGFDTKYITMQCINSQPDDIKVGDFVKVNDTGDALLAEAGKTFIGVVVGVNENYYTVQIGGYCEVQFAGETLPMYARLTINKRGVVQVGTGTDAPFRKVLWVDKSENRAGIIL